MATVPAGVELLQGAAPEWSGGQGRGRAARQQVREPSLHLASLVPDASGPGTHASLHPLVTADVRGHRWVWSGVIEEGVADRQGGTVTSIPLSLPAAPPSRLSAANLPLRSPSTVGSVPMPEAKVGKGEEKGEGRREKGQAAATGSRRDGGHGTPTAAKHFTRDSAQPALPARAHDAQPVPLWLGGKKEAAQGGSAVHRGDEGEEEDGEVAGKRRGSQGRGQRVEAKEEAEDGKAGTPNNASGTRRLSRARLGQAGGAARKASSGLNKPRDQEGEGTKPPSAASEGGKDEAHGGRRRSSEPKTGTTPKAAAGAHPDDQTELGDLFG